MSYTGSVILGLLACLPSSFTVQADVFDMEMECWDTNVQVTLQMKYWREEWTQMGEGECGFDESVVATTDRRCIVLPRACVDRPPTKARDPAFQSRDGDAAICTAAYNGDYPWRACPAPALTEWP